VFTLPTITRRVLPKFASLMSATILTLIIVTATSHLLGFEVERVHLNSTLKSVGDLNALVAAQWPTQW
jgi:hypothetical protein